MKSVLLSINPSWCNLIFLGIKTLEIRKTKPNMGDEPFKCYVYCTKTKNGWFKECDGYLEQLDGKVIGEFTCNHLYEITPESDCLPEGFEEMSGLRKKEILDYVGKKGWAWSISNVKLYEHPKFLFEFTHYCILMGNRGVCNFNKVRCNYQVEELGETNRRFCNKCLKRAPQSWCYVEG